MQSKSKSASRMEVNVYNISSPATSSEPWWRSMGYNSIPSTEIGGNTSNSSFFEQSKDCQSQSDDGMDEDEDDDDAIKELQITASPHSDGNYGQDNQNFQHQTSVIPRTSNENLTQPPQFELVGRSIACTSNPYQDPYYGGMMAGYGPPPLVPHLLDVHYARLPLALEMAQEPVYVNAKQYCGILRRRQSRAKAELEKKLIKARKPYLHESRHQHAMRRARASGGRFAKKSNTLKCTTKEMGTASVSTSSSGSEPLHNEATEIRNSHQEAKGPEVHKTFEARGYTDRSEGDSSDHQWGSVSSNKASQRALAT